MVGIDLFALPKALLPGKKSPSCFDGDAFGRSVNKGIFEEVRSCDAGVEVLPHSRLKNIAHTSE
jgi:hypothetical protein